jgi:hypothetical protein
LRRGRDVRDASKKVVVSLVLLSFLVSAVTGVLAEVPPAVALQRAGLVSAAFGTVSTLIVFLTERA